MWWVRQGAETRVTQEADLREPMYRAEKSYGVVGETLETVCGDWSPRWEMW